MHKATFCFFTLVSVLVFSSVPLVQSQEVNGGNITFQQNSIPDVNVYYEDYSFVFEYKSFFIRIRPFVIYNGSYYGMKKIVQWIKNNYPNVNYKWLVDKAIDAIHYGFNLTKLPQKVADKIDYLGFRLVDLNFPLSWFEVEEILSEPDLGYNITRIHIPKANLILSFEDLYPQGYTVKHINSTYILVGGVKNQTDLIIDPITLSGGIITVIGGTEGSELDSVDIWNADQSNGWNVFHNNHGNNTQFQSDVRIVLGNGTVAGTTWFADEDKQIYFSEHATTANYQVQILVKNYAHYRSGKVISVSEKTSENGNSFISNVSYYGNYLIGCDAGGEFELYSSSFTHIGAGTQYRIYTQTANTEVWECTFDNVYLYTLATDACDVYRYTGVRGTYGIMAPRGTYDDLFIHDVGRGVYVLYNWATTITNLKLRDCAIVEVITYQITTDKYFINPDFDGWTFEWAGGVGTNTAEIWRQYDFDLTVTYPNGTAVNGTATGTRAVIRHYGNNSAVDYNATLNSDGTINQTILNMGFYNQTGASQLYNYNPYGLTIYNATGYQTYTKNFTLSEKTEWTIALTPTLQPAPSTILAVAGFAFTMFTVATAIIIIRRKKQGPEA